MQKNRKYDAVELSLGLIERLIPLVKRKDDEKFVHFTKGILFAPNL